MGFVQLFKDFFGMVALDEKAYKRATKTRFKTTFLVFLLIAIAIAIGSVFIIKPKSGGIGGAFVYLFIYSLLLMPIIWLFITTIFWGSARLFGGKGGFQAHYNGLSITMLWAVLCAIPFIGFLLAGAGSLWTIIMNIFFVRELHKLPTGKAVFAVMIPYTIFIIILLLLLVGIFFLYLTMTQSLTN